MWTLEGSGFSPGHYSPARGWEERVVWNGMAGADSKENQKTCAVLDRTVGGDSRMQRQKSTGAAWAEGRDIGPVGLTDGTELLFQEETDERCKHIVKAGKRKGAIART